MANVTKLCGQYDADRPGPSDTTSTNTNAYNLAFNTTQTFELVYEQRPKLQRQWPAFLRCTSDKDNSVTQVLARLDWPSQGNVRIVDVSHLFPSYVTMMLVAASASSEADIIHTRSALTQPKPLKLWFGFSPRCTLWSS
jgi:hypothetical protein